MRFYDTNAIMRLGKGTVDIEKFCISSVTLQELEKLKTDTGCTEEQRNRARKTIKLLDAHPEWYEVAFYNRNVKKMLGDMFLDSSHNDYRICGCALSLQQDGQAIEFVTNDISCKNIASRIFGLKVIPCQSESIEDYKGFKEISMDDEEMAAFYSNLSCNAYSLMPNEYLIVKNRDNAIVDKYCWRGGIHQSVAYRKIENSYHNAIKPYKGDVYQQCVLHSFQNNQLTMVKGKAGTGKSYLSLGFLLAMLEKHKIDKIIIFCNPVAVRDAARLGFYPGSRDEKIMDSVIGNMLSAKLGSSYAIEQMIAREELLLLPVSDIRGYDTSGSKAGVYITEAQNMSIDLMKLVLQRIGEDSICIIDGDYSAQVDLDSYAGNKNGMRRMSEVFRGQDFYGEIELQNIYRSRIASVAERM